MKRVRPERVTHALKNLSRWRESVQGQASTHLAPLLALLEAGAGSENQVVFNETPDEFEFWDRYFKLSDGNDDKPYFNPVLLRRAEKGFPHSNAATIRKNTFELKWKAAARANGPEGELWTLSADYADIFRSKVLTRKGQVTRVPVLDVACILFRDDQFEDQSNAHSLEVKFRARFGQNDADYEKLFVFKEEEADHIFLTTDDAINYDSAIVAALLDDVASVKVIGDTSAQNTSLPLDDAILNKVQQILSIGTSGIIFTGPPGTGKSYYAKRIARHLVNNPDSDIFRVQFHPSYGYEDFIEGYRPEEKSTSGFTIEDKIFAHACARARETEGFIILLIDEINRGDPSRIFGELLTHIEMDYRDVPFSLPFSGKDFVVPPNLLLLATMNPHDRSVSHIDAAFVRRFDHIVMSPSREVVESMLEGATGFEADQITMIGEWFDTAQALVPFGLGHSFFKGIADTDHLRLVWQYRIQPTALTASEVNEGRYVDFVKSFEALVNRLEGVAIGG